LNRRETEQHGRRRSAAWLAMATVEKPIDRQQLAGMMVCLASLQA
jgi:hypothetical protein